MKRSCWTARAWALFHAWLRQSIAEGKLLNELARDLIAAPAAPTSTPRPTSTTSRRSAGQQAEATAQVFLGIRLAGAPVATIILFDRWTQNGSSQPGGLLCPRRLSYRREQPLRQPRQAPRVLSASRSSTRVVWVRCWSPQTQEGKPRPCFLGADGKRPPGRRRGPACSSWPTGSHVQTTPSLRGPRSTASGSTCWVAARRPQRRLSRLQSSCQRLLCSTPWLKDFVAHHFDLRHLVRNDLELELTSLSPLPNDSNRDDETNCMPPRLRPLQAEQPARRPGPGVTGVPAAFTGFPSGTTAGQAAQGDKASRGQRSTEGERFLSVFGKPPRSTSWENAPTTILSVKPSSLLTGDTLNTMLSTPDNRLGTLLTSGKTDEESCRGTLPDKLSRLPTTKERAGRDPAGAEQGPRALLEDLTWGLVNAKELLLEASRSGESGYRVAALKTWHPRHLSS